MNRRRQEIARLRRLAALKMRLAGASLGEIAAKLQVDFSTAMRDVHRALDELVAENRAECEALRAVELARLDGLISAHWPKATGTEGEEPDPHSAMIVLRCVSERSRLQGRYAQYDDDGERRGISIDELRELVERQRAAVARAAAIGVTIALPAPSDPNPAGNGSAPE